MTGLLEIRERIKMLYSRYEVFILPIVKFLFALIVLNTLNGKIGYMTRLDNIAIVLIVSLMCSFLPTGCIVMFGAVFSLLHLYALSMEVALVGLCMFLVMFLLFFRFSPKDSVLVLVTPLLCAMKIPYVVPIAAGLLCSPASVVSVGCGVAVHYFFQTVLASAPALGTMEDSDAIAKLRLIIDGIIKNKEMLVVIAAFAITILVVYLIRRMSFDHVWTIAMVAGAMTDIVILLVGDLVYDINLSVGFALLGSLLALAVAKVIEFFRFCVDYSRTEKVQFEDDEYYYYVKAVPKMTVSAPAKTVKRINTQRHRSGERSVTMERVPERTRSRAGGMSGAGRARGDYRGGKSVTVGNVDLDDENTESDDYEELF
ncbi:MAG: hypothetical protein NC123_06625 [Butyrivibrio sp.]|nr:hypothetical protein [Acetatifactor muris]MCM1559202.1 hypothetical protein [Butyrivibrio sp.]